MEQRKVVIKEKDTILGRRDSKEVPIWGGGVLLRRKYMVDSHEVVPPTADILGI